MEDNLEALVMQKFQNVLNPTSPKKQEQQFV